MDVFLPQDWASRDGLDNGTPPAWVTHAKVEAASHEPRIGNRMMHCCVGESDCHTDARKWTDFAAIVDIPASRITNADSGSAACR